MFFLLTFAFLSMVYVWYDILYLEIPENILLVLIGIVFFSWSIGIFYPEYALFSHLGKGNILEISHAMSLIIF